MEISRNDIIVAFWQQGANNCASIALIKAAIETFGLNNVFKLTNNEGRYEAELQNKDIVHFNDKNLQDSIREGSFQPGKEDTPSKQELYEEIRKYAQLCFAVMAAQYDKKNNINNYDLALSQLVNGANARFVSQYLGLEDHASPVFKGGAYNPNMIAWQHMPWLKHVVYMSQNSYDYYGVEHFNTGKFPKRIMFHSTKQDKFVKAGDQFTELNFINVSRFGTFQDTGRVHSIPQDIDRIIDHIKKNGLKKLLIHFHGGLISENMGINSAEVFYNNFIDSENTHTVSIVWETGIFEALPETLRRILQTDDLLRRLIVKVAKFLGMKLDVDLKILENSMLPASVENYANLFYPGTKDLTADELSSVFSEYQELINFEEKLRDQIHNELREITEDEELAEEDLDRMNMDDPEKESLFIDPMILWYAAKIAARCVKRFIKKRDHGVWPTIVEEAFREIRLDDFGTEIWSVMKDQAKTMWKSNKGRSGLNQFAGRYLLDELAENFTSEDLEISIVAHSAGAVAACEWVNLILSNLKTLFSWPRPVVATYSKIRL